MRILDRYICREVFSHALLGLAVFTFVFFIPQLVRLMDLVVRHSGGGSQVALLFACAFPGILVFTLPMSALVGVLIGLGRLSADGEIIGMNASGIGLRRLLVPIGLLAMLMSGLTLVDTLWLSPLSLRTMHALEGELRASQATFAIEPRVFDERFPNFVLYVQDVDASAARWRGVLLAQTDQGPQSRLTLAEDAIVVADRSEDKVQLHLGPGSTHEYNPEDPLHYGYSSFGGSDLAIDLSNQTDVIKPLLTNAERSASTLLTDSGRDSLQARVEWQRRLAFPAACIVFALLGVPVGVRPRSGGRSAGFILTLLLVSAYYMVLVMGLHMAQQGTVNPVLGVWLANVVATLVALGLIARIEQVRGEGWVGHLLFQLHQRFGRNPVPLPTHERASAGVGRHQTGEYAMNGESPRVVPISAAAANESALRNQGGSAVSFPRMIDWHILRTFFSYFLLLLAGFVAIFDAFTLFDLLNDITRNHASVAVVTAYFRYLVPAMLYDLAPLAALVATLVTLAVLAKNNELTAFKANGISLYRVTLPLLVAGLLLAGGMFVLDDTYLPYANQRQDALRNQIKGKPPQTFYEPTHRWIFGAQARVYNYDFFDSDRNLFAGLNIFELDPATFQMRRRIYAAQAHWEPALGAWVLENGWVRDFAGATVTQYKTFRVSTFGELTELPGYFKREVTPSSQMNWQQLGRYIAGLRQAGFDTARLSVEWQKKFSFPLIAVIIVFLGAPFAFLVGTRGAIGGISVAIGISIFYWAMAALLEAMGSVGQLPPLLAGWAPDAIFAFLGAYFFLRIPT
jgi:LPS export ABC transporter permease LptF/LPS export ABC transporter permease LptG